MTCEHCKSTDYSHERLEIENKVLCNICFEFFMKLQFYKLNAEILENRINRRKDGFICLLCKSQKRGTPNPYCMKCITKLAKVSE